MELLTRKTVQNLSKLIEVQRERIFNVADSIWKNPELGYREYKTTAFMIKQFEELGYKPIPMERITGFYADLDTGRPGPMLAVLGELDGVICAEHPDADPQTGAVHACGHHTQCAYLVGLAALLCDPEVLSELSGKIRFIAVPAEETIDRKFFTSLFEQGIVRYSTGKPEFLYRGVFDGVDAAVMIHSGTGSDSLEIRKGGNGSILQDIVFIGKSNHTANPSGGINALQAASLGIQAINSIRDTFIDENATRVHYIIKNGGKFVSVIPETIQLQLMVRSITIESIINETKKIRRALAGSAIALGAHIQICSNLGYMPLYQDDNFNEIMLVASKAMLGESRAYCSGRYGKACTDMGDLSCVMPVMHPFIGGKTGAVHGADYHILEPETSCIDSTRCIAGLTYALLCNGGAQLRKIKENYKPMFTSYQDYFAFVDSMNNDRELVSYEGETATAMWQFDDYKT